MTRHRTHAVSASLRTCLTLSRIAAAVIGGYAFAWGFAALGSMLLARFGMARTEAIVTATMLGFVVYLAAILWAFAARRLGIVWLVLAGGGTVATGLAHWLAGGR